MNELFEEMENDYKNFCASAQRFIDAYKEAQQEQQPIQEEPDYKSWVGQIVYVWNHDYDNRQKAVLLNYDSWMAFPFRVVGGGFKHAELCKE